ncbi:mitochondrial ribosomal protein S25-domain-containing protein [Phlyctochytrium arcticum]|nr:mitochondrial ribosomal protein S25-domain-containing protein [Phlyctochytrium arcticum]
MAAPLKNNPYTLVKNVNRLVATGRLKRPPAWYGAVKLYPQATFTPRGIPPVELGAFVPSTSSKSQANKELQPYTHKTAQRPDIRTYRPHYYVRPNQIVYPEDEIRAAFYRWHPLELARPRTLVEREDEIGNRDWSTITGGKPGRDVVAENVVQRTLCLMQPHKDASTGKKFPGLPRHQAYQQSLREFYAERAVREERQAAARQAAIDAAIEEDRETFRLAMRESLIANDIVQDHHNDGELVDDAGCKIDELVARAEEKQFDEDRLYWANRPLSDRFQAWEEEQMFKARDYEDKIKSAREARRETQERMAAHDKRNLLSDSPDGESSEPILDDAFAPPASSPTAGALNIPFRANKSRATPTGAPHPSSQDTARVLEKTLFSSSSSSSQQRQPDMDAVRTARLQKAEALNDVKGDAAAGEGKQKWAGIFNRLRVSAASSEAGHAGQGPQKK